jgi:hypothetical protein
LGTFEYFLPRERYEPVALLRWIETVRESAWNTANRQSDTLGIAPQVTLYAGPSTLPYGPWPRERWFVALRGCSSLNITPAGGNLPHALLALLDSAARLAARYRATPLRIERLEPHDISEVSCPAKATSIVMPLAPPSVSRGTTAPSAIEVLTQFVVNSHGVVDTSSIEFFPLLSGGFRALAVSAIAGWKFEAATIAGTPVAQIWHHPLIFLDSARAAWDPAGIGAAGISRFRWRDRDDGLVQIPEAGSLFGRLDETGHIVTFPVSAHSRSPREYFHPADVHRWVAAVTRLRDSALTAPAVPVFMTDHAFGKDTAAWRVTLRNSLGRSLKAKVTRPGAPGTAVFVSYEHSECDGDASIGSVLSASSAESALMLRSATEAANASSARRPAPAIDSLRTYGELEVACVAIAGLGHVPEQVRIADSVEASLSLPRDALVAFVVMRDGRVNGSSIHVMGKWSRGEVRRISAALSRVRFKPATFAGVRVAQRAHYLIRGILTPRLPDSTLQSLDLQHH